MIWIEPFCALQIMENRPLMLIIIFSMFISVLASILSGKFLHEIMYPNTGSPKRAALFVLLGAVAGYLTTMVVLLSSAAVLGQG
jgi:hypothetical protein